MNLKQSILNYEKNKKPMDYRLELLKLRCWLVGLTIWSVVSVFILALYK